MQYNYTFYELLIHKSIFNIKNEVARYYLNYLWWIIEPALTITTFYFIFGIMLNRGTQNFPSFLVIGIVTWKWFSNSVNHCSNSLLTNKNLILQTDIPKIFFPLEIFIRNSFKQFFVMSLTLLFITFSINPKIDTWISLPLLLIIQSLYIIGIGALCSSIVPFIPDAKFIISTLIHLAMYGSGIFFSIDDVVLPEHRFIMYMNPMAGLIKNYREILMYGRWPDWTYLGYLTLGGIALCALAFFVLHKLDHVYPRVCQQ